jgi:hypothetical protein
MWIGIVALVHVSVAQVIFGTFATEVAFKPVKEPEGPALAAFGAIVLSISIVYVFVLARNRDGY